ncbi:MAG: sensor histidine kinase, partial [Verrucomicrobia bacterium]|nr:sensor histidine kinase [Verrucomicrobiota bacterium]
RMEQGRQQYELEPMDVVRWLRETTRLMEPLAGERGVAIVCALPPDTAGRAEPWTATWDARAMQQALLNLLDNALKHSPAGSTVRVELERTESLPVRFHLRVRDQGPGIPAEDHARIFERFHRRGSELRRETQGIGLGLSIVRHIVEAHGGRVWVESEVGRGRSSMWRLQSVRRESGHGPHPDH